MMRDSSLTRAFAWFLVGFQSWKAALSFEGRASFRARHRIHSKGTELWSSVSDNGDAMRRMLEESWNTSKMGRVPANPESAAEEAYSSILQASGAKSSGDGTAEFDEEGSSNGVFFVDLLLPSYDMSLVQEGVNLYDEVAAVEYCISLANCFQGKTQILVKDNTIVETVTKILSAREEFEKEKASAEEASVSDGDVVFGNGDLTEPEENSQGNTPIVVTSDPDRDAFREQLLANWNDNSEAPVEDGINMGSSQAKSVTKTPTSTSKPYRLASLFGNYRIFQGADMANMVIQAVRENALAAEDEDNIIVLSARGQDEMIAVRGLVAKYAAQKKIILVNCQFQPIPRELLSAETVYSVLPLAGKKTTEDPNDNKDESSKPPKIVVLRRYPKDWEIFVDVGIGYELAETVQVTTQNKRGLPMDFIARAVTRHLDYVSRR